MEILLSGPVCGKSYLSIEDHIMSDHFTGKEDGIANTQ